MLLPTSMRLPDFPLTLGEKVEPIRDLTRAQKDAIHASTRRKIFERDDHQPDGTVKRVKRQSIGDLMESLFEQMMEATRVHSFPPIVIESPVEHVEQNRTVGGLQMLMEAQRRAMLEENERQMAQLERRRERERLPRLGGLLGGVVAGGAGLLGGVPGSISPNLADVAKVRRELEVGYGKRASFADAVNREYEQPFFGVDEAKPGAVVCAQGEFTLRGQGQPIKPTASV